MRAARLLPEPLRRLAPEAFAFAVIGAANSVLYFVIFNAALGIGAVKATIIATLVTTTLSYLANRHWTYKHRSRTALRREYTLFFAFNFAGLVIQATAVGFGKYGIGLTEDKHRLALNAVTLVGVAAATVFRFWAYRTFVFLKLPPDPDTGMVPARSPLDPAGPALDADALAHFDPAAELAEVVVEQATQGQGTPQPRGGSPRNAQGPFEAPSDGLDAEIAAEIAAARRPAGR